MSLRKQWIFAFNCLLMAACTLPACTEPPPPTLSYPQRLLVDSLYNFGVDSLRPLLDSLCTAQFDSLVQRNADSMMQERLEEIERYLERIRREQNQNQ